MSRFIDRVFHWLLVRGVWLPHWVRWRLFRRLIQDSVEEIDQIYRSKEEANERLPL